MTPLTQQLEDKKKELLELTKEAETINEVINNNEGNIDAGMENDIIKIENKIVKLQAEIAILEQAIAEIKNIQSQQLKVEVSESEKIVRGTPRADTPQDEIKSSDLVSNSVVSNLLQKQRQDFERILNRIIGKLEDGRNQREEITDYCKDKKQQLNQPKTEQ